MIRKIFRQMLVTQILSAMTVMMCMLVDSMMIGRFLGVDAMTAYGLANPVLLIFAAYGAMLSAGVQVMCGRTMGAGDRAGTDACYSAAVALALGVSLGGMALVLLLVSPLCTLLGAGRAGAGGRVFLLTREYLRGFIVGAPGFIVAQIMVPFLQISGNRGRLAAAVVLMTLSDVAFDLLNVFVFRGGMLGMGLASSLSYYVALLVGLPYFFKKDCMFRLDRKAVKGKLCRSLLGDGVPTVINSLAMVVLVFALNKILLSVGGNRAVAACSVISTVGNLCYCFGAGVASVALLLASILYSDEDRTAIYTLVRTQTCYAVVLDLALIGAVLALAPALAGLFLNDPGARVMTVRGLRLFCLSLLPSALNTTFKNYYQGVGRTRLTEVISLLQNMTFPVLTALVLSRFWGTTGVWLAFLGGELLTMAFLAVRVLGQRRKGASLTEAFALLPDSFGVPDEDRIEMTIRSRADVPEALRQAAAFCKSHHEDARTSALIPLCVEEMVYNILEHGFRPGRRDQSVDVRILFKGDSRVIRIRDNCVNFDPVTYLELHRSDDSVAHVGIRMIMRMVKSAKYVNSLGLNNLTLAL